MYDPTGAHGHLYASVCCSPLQLLPAGERKRGLDGLDRALTRARIEEDHAAVCRFSCALFDYHLERGHLGDARDFLFEAEVTAMAQRLVHEAIEVELRSAWMDYLTATPGCRERLEAVLTRARADGTDLQQAVAALYVALVRARSGELDGMHSLISGAQSTLRTLGAPEPLARMSLMAAMAYQSAGEHDLATIEALRVRALAATRDDARLKTASDAVLASLGGKQGTDRRVHHLVSVAIEVGRQRRLSDVLRSVVTSTAELLSADRAFVLRRTESGPKVVAAHATHGEPGAPSASIVRQAIELGREVVTADIGIDSELGAAASVMSQGVRTALCVPMMDGPVVIGAIYADSAESAASTLSEAAWLIRAFAAHAVAAVRNAEHLQQTERRMLRAREMNHDVRNLVSALNMGLGELDEEANLEPWARDLVKQLSSVTKLIRSQVEDSLSETVPSLTRLELGALVRRAAEVLRFDANQRQVTLEVAVAEAYVMATEGGMTRVVANLVGNALKYAPVGSTVTVSLAKREGVAVLQVRDQGQGLPAGSEADVFRSGVQAEGHVEGHGLGLGICRRLISESGGTVRAYNADTGGAVFEAAIPLA